MTTAAMNTSRSTFAAVMTREVSKVVVESVVPPPGSACVVGRLNRGGGGGCSEVVEMRGGGGLSLVFVQFTNILSALWPSKINVGQCREEGREFHLSKGLWT